jgi:hypothetical protein
MERREAPILTTATTIDSISSIINSFGRRLGKWWWKNCLETFETTGSIPQIKAETSLSHRNRRQQRHGTYIDNNIDDNIDNNAAVSTRTTETRPAHGTTSGLGHRPIGRDNYGPLDTDSRLAHETISHGKYIWLEGSIAARKSRGKSCSTNGQRGTFDDTRCDVAKRMSCSRMQAIVHFDFNLAALLSTAPR